MSTNKIETSVADIEKELAALDEKEAILTTQLREIEKQRSDIAKLFQRFVLKVSPEVEIPDITPAKRGKRGPVKGTKRGPRAKGDGKMSAKDAVLKVITDSKEPVTVDQIKDTVAKFGKWSEAAVNGALNQLRNKEKSIKAVTRGVYAVK